MIGVIFRVIKSPALIMSLFVISFAAGIWLGVTIKGWISKNQEIDAYKMQIERIQKTANSDKEAQRKLYEDKLKIERGRVRYEQIVKVVPADSDCAVPPDADRLLEAHRAGLSEAPAGATGNTSDAEGSPSLQISGLVHADADLADDYHACRQQIIRLNEWYQLQQ